MKKCSFGVLVFSGLVSLGLLLSSPSMLYALDLNNTDEGSASNVAIASVESAIDAQRDSTFAVEQNSQVDNETPSEVSNQIVWHQGWISPEEGAGFWRWGLSDGTIAVSSWRHINGSWYWFDAKVEWLRMDWSKSGVRLMDSPLRVQCVSAGT